MMPKRAIARLTAVWLWLTKNRARPLKPWSGDSIATPKAMVSRPSFENDGFSSRSLIVVVVETLPAEKRRLGSQRGVGDEFSSDLEARDKLGS